MRHTSEPMFGSLSLRWPSSIVWVMAIVFLLCVVLVARDILMDWLLHTRCSPSLDAEDHWVACMRNASRRLPLLTVAALWNFWKCAGLDLLPFSVSNLYNGFIMMKCQPSDENTGMLAEDRLHI